MDEQNEKQEQSSQTKASKKPFPATAIVCLVIGIAAIIGPVAFLLINNSNQNEENVPSHIHSFGDWETAKTATCSAEGIKERYCTCGETQTASIEKVAHSFGEEIITREATCDKEGVKTSTCAICNEIVSDTIPKTAHTYSTHTVTKPATCKEEGIKTFECSVCSKKITESIPKTDVHTLVTDRAVAATCTKTGLTEGKHCSVCGTVTVSQTVTAIIPHTIVETITKQASSTEYGTKEKRCTNCSYSTTESYILTLLSSEEIYELAKKSVGEVKTYKKGGSGLALGTAFVYSSDGKLITNYHVIEGAYSAKVTIDGETYDVAKVLAYDKDIDIAIIKINKTGLVPLSIQNENIKGGATVYAVGSSEGYTLSFSTGVIASPSRNFDGVEYIQHEAAISHGNSGGPLFNAYGEVIGINTLTNIDGQNLNFAISCKELSNISYGTELTMTQFYEKECDPFTLIKNYVIENGTYDSDDNEYSVTYKTSYSSDYTSKYINIVEYNASNNELDFVLFIDGSSNCMLTFTVDSAVSGYYEWNYIDDYEYYMTGTITARTYTDNTLLGYSYNNIYYSSLRDSVRKLSSSMVDLILTSIDVYLYQETGVTASDLGFISY